MIVAFAGFKHVGKSTAAKYLVDRYGFSIVSFAYPLKRCVQQVYDFSDEQLFGYLKDEPDLRYPRGDGTYLTPRLAFERFGTEAGRYCYPRTWINKALRSDVLADQAAGRGGLYTFEDARFPNEFDAIYEAGGHVIRLVRDGVGPSDHASETEQAKLPDSFFSAVINTSLPVEQTRARLDEFLSGVGVAA